MADGPADGVADGSGAPAPAAGAAPRRFLAGDGRLLMEAAPRRGGGLGLTLAPGAARADLERAFAKLLDEIAPDGVLGGAPGGASGGAPECAPGGAPGQETA
jgi:hypothetical protein